MTTKTPKFSALLIDDDPFMENTVIRSLSKFSNDNFEVIYASRIQQALPHLEVRTFDIVLLDNILSRETNALSSVTRLKRADNTPPIAVITSDTTPDYLQKTDDLGVEYIIDKIVLIAFLREIVAEWTVKHTSE